MILYTNEKGKTYFWKRKSYVLNENEEYLNFEFRTKYKYTFMYKQWMKWRFSIQKINAIKVKII